MQNSQNSSPAAESSPLEPVPAAKYQKLASEFAKVQYAPCKISHPYMYFYNNYLPTVASSSQCLEKGRFGRAVQNQFVKGTTARS